MAQDVGKGNTPSHIVPSGRYKLTLFAPDQFKHLHWRMTDNLNGRLGGTIIVITQERHGLSGKQNDTGPARLFQPGRDIHGITPDVIGILPFANNTRDDRACMDAHPHCDVIALFAVQTVQAL
jgi:hypothetical protein